MFTFNTKTLGIQILHVARYALLPVFFLLTTHTTYAKIEVKVDRSFEVTRDYKMKVVEKHTVTNNSQDLRIPAYENEIFTILGFRVGDPKMDKILDQASKSISSRVDGDIKTAEVTIDANIAKVALPYSSNLDPGETRIFELEYTHPALVYKNGAVIDVYINAFSKDFKFESDTMISSYNTKLLIPDWIRQEINFVSPTPTNNRIEGDFHIYEFDQESLVDQFVWMQLGKEQLFDFTITQKIKSTEDRDTGKSNEYIIVLPRDIEAGEVEQEVWYRSMHPTPSSVYTDQDSNLFAKFVVPTNFDGEINISGVAIVKKKSDINFVQKVSHKADIPKELIDKYTAEAEYWEVNHPKVRDKASQISKSENVYTVTSETYKYVVNSIDYSNVKRFGINDRHGALKTLEGGAAVCMEYSDLFLSLMRANSVPTRAVFGYGYDPRVDNSAQEAHQWVQVYMPGIDEWVDVDVTWGEAGDVLIGGDLNHFYTHVASQDPNTPAMVSRVTYGDSGSLDAPDFDINIVERVDDKTDLKSTNDLLTQYPVMEKSSTRQKVDRLVSQYKAGFRSMTESGLDISNGSQLLLLNTVFVVLVALFLVRKIMQRMRA